MNRLILKITMLPKEQTCGLSKNEAVHRDERFH